MTLPKDEARAKQKEDCRKKQSFLSKEDALAKSMFYEDHNKIKLQPYKCKVCGRFHLTRQEGKVQ